MVYGKRNIGERPPEEPLPAEIILEPCVKFTVEKNLKLPLCGGFRHHAAALFA